MSRRRIKPAFAGVKTPSRRGNVELPLFFGRSRPIGPSKGAFSGKTASQDAPGSAIPPSPRPLDPPKQTKVGRITVLTLPWGILASSAVFALLHLTNDNAGTLSAPFVDLDRSSHRLEPRAGRRVRFSGQRRQGGSESDRDTSGRRDALHRWGFRAGGGACRHSRITDRNRLAVDLR